MVYVYEEKRDGMPYANITLTRGDDCTLVLPIYTVDSDGNSTPYTPAAGDTFQLQVRSGYIDGGSITPIVLFNGNVSVSGTTLVWEISAAQSTQKCTQYVWDAQITTAGGKIYTFYQGFLTIVPEVTTSA